VSDEKQASTWQRVCPSAAWQHPTLRSIAAYLDHPDTQSALRGHELARTYPGDVVSRLFELGLGEVLAGEPGGAGALQTYHHSFAVLERLASASGSLGIIIGVNVLALGTVCMGAQAPLRQRICADLGQGRMCAIVLSEWARGSDLRSTQSRAEPGVLDAQGAFTVVPAGGTPTHYRITGTKDLINGGRTNHWLITLVRVDGEDSPGGLTLLAVPRDQSVVVTRRWTTLPAPAADISSIEYAGTVVPAENLVGAVGGGLRLVMYRVARARGGISVLAAGTTHRAVQLTEDYLHSRELHGQALYKYPALVEHMHRLEAIDLAVASLSAKTALAMSSPRIEPAYITAVAKLACCSWAERAVDEGRRVLSSRALLEEEPFTRLVRDVLLYSVFDGTRHVVLAQLAKYVRQLVDPKESPADVLLRDAVGQDPVRWHDAPLPRLARPTVPALAAHLDWLADHAGRCQSVAAALGQLAHHLETAIGTLVAQGRWKDQALAFPAAEAATHLEMGAALLGFGHGPCRDALGLPEVAASRAHDDLLVDTGAAMLGMAAAELLLQLNPDTAPALTPVMGCLAQAHADALQAVIQTYPRR